MNQYLKEKLSAPEKTNAEDFLDKEKNFNQQLKELIASKPEMVEDFQKPMVKDLKVEKIDKRGVVQPLTSGADFQAKIAAARKGAIKQAAGAAEDTLDYTQFKKQFADKARLAAKSPAAKKLMGVVPVLGGLANALISGDASAAVPVLDSAESLGPAAGTIDSRIESGTLTEEDKAQLRLQALRNMR